MHWKIDFGRICGWFVEGLRGVVGVCWGCLGGVLSVYEGFSAKIAILAVLAACVKAFWGRSGRHSVHWKIDFCWICLWFVEGAGGVLGVCWG